MTDETFVVVAERPLDDPVGWALAHPGLLAPGFEFVASKPRLPEGYEIPALGIDGEGRSTIVYALEEAEDAALFRLATLAGALGHAGEWLRRKYPECRWQAPPIPRLVVLASAFTPEFARAVRGLAAAHVLLLRARTVEGADGSRVVLVERHGSDIPSGPSRSGLTDEEEAFFRSLEEERRAMAYR
ncbi:MAG: hypothetical protein HY900_20725 [Deltaproteobacteria bacterium]|nr:hypothetical protein [Deltaproteobacteria bacterium]